MTNKYYFASFKRFLFYKIYKHYFLITYYLKDIYNTLPGNIPALIVHETLLHTAWFIDVLDMMMLPLGETSAEWFLMPKTLALY